MIGVESMLLVIEISNLVSQKFGHDLKGRDLYLTVFVCGCVCDIGNKESLILSNF